jgi:hypothetical protein
MGAHFVFTCDTTQIRPKAFLKIGSNGEVASFGAEDAMHIV